MKYPTQITIELPQDKVIELFDNPNNLEELQSELQSFKHFEGELGQAGAKWPEGGEVVTRGKIN